MDESQFNTQVDAVMQRIEAGLEASEVDLDFSMIGSGVLEIEFADGSKIIVNRHGVAQELWVAARSGGYHYRWDGCVWRDTRNGGELMSTLSALLSAQAGSPVVLA